MGGGASFEGVGEILLNSAKSPIYKRRESVHLSRMQQIDIDFEVYKALTAQRLSESHTYNDVLRAILNLPETGLQTDLVAAFAAGDDMFGRVIGGRFLPSGTSLRARYKSRLYSASIVGNELVLEGGKTFRTASAAAKEITGTNVNGLTFWEIRRPKDSDWKIIKALPKDCA